MSLSIRSYYQFLITLSGFCLVFSYASAQEKLKNLDLDELVVTGQYEANSLNKSVLKVRVIDAKRIQSQGAFNLQQVLTNELNVRIVQDPVLGSSMQLQGVGGNSIKILIDGIPVIGRENGSIDLSQINLQNVERIELVEGPMSVNFGTDALGGVINIITKKPTQTSKQAKLGAYCESIGQYNLNGSLNYSIKKYGIQANFGRNFFKGFSEDPESRVKLWKPRTQYQADLGMTRFFERGSIRWTNQYFHEKITDRGLPNIDWSQAYALDRYYYTTRYTSSIFYDAKYEGKRNLNILASYNLYQRRFNTYSKDLVGLTENIVPSSVENDTSWFHQVMSRGTYSNVAFLSKMNYQMGYEFTHDLAFGSRIENQSQNMGDYNIFASSEIKPLKRLLVKPAFRLMYHTKFKAPVIPSVNIKYDWNENLSIRGSYSRGFRAPSLKELYLQFVDASHNVKGNPNLTAETSNNIILGATYSYKQENKLFRVEPSLFYNYISDMIDLARVGTGTNASFQYVNINTFSSLGLTMNTEYKTLPYQISLGYSYTGRKNELSGFDPSAKYFFSHEWRVNAAYNIKKIGLNLNVFCKINGKLQMYQYDYLKNEVALNFIDPFAILDLSIGKSFLRDRMMLNVGVKNLLNVINVNANFSSGPHNSASNAASTAMGRSVFVGLNYSIFK